MTIEQILGVTLTVLGIIAALGVGLRWVIRHYLADILKEVKPNSGSSIKDQVTRLEKKTENLEIKIDNLYNILITDGVKTIKASRPKNPEL
jgi:hypothetical protein